jgi:hypothetical protein
MTDKQQYSRCSCGLFIKELGDELRKSENRIINYRHNNDKYFESEWSVISTNTDRIKMAMNSAEKACNINTKEAKEYYYKLQNSLPDIITEKGRKMSIGFIHRIDDMIIHTLDKCNDQQHDKYK